MAADEELHFEQSAAWAGTVRMLEGNKDGHSERSNRRLEYVLCTDLVTTELSLHTLSFLITTAA